MKKQEKYYELKTYYAANNYMQIYNKYILKSLFYPTIVTTLVITVMIWIIQALRFIDLLVNTGIDLSNFFYLTILLIPSIIYLIIPIAFYIAVIIAYNKLYSTSEITVLSSAGLSKFQILKPALTLALMIVIINYFISLYLLPIANHEFKNKIKFFKDNYISMLVQEGVFAHPTKNISIYVSKRISNDEFEDIFIHDYRNKNFTTTITARKGFFLKNSNYTILSLSHGNRQEIDNNSNSNILYFDNLELDLDISPKEQSTRNLTISEMNINQLLFPTSSNINSIKINKMKSEGHFRIIWPFTVVILSFLAVGALISGDFSRSGKRKRIIIASSMATAIIIVLIGSNNLGGKLPSLIPLQYIIILLSIYIGSRNFYYKEKSNL